MGSSGITGEPNEEGAPSSVANAPSREALRRSGSVAAQQTKHLAPIPPQASAQGELARLTRELTDERRQRLATSESPGAC
jgi:hypothetical protein